MVVKIDTDTMEDGAVVAKKLGGAGEGLPWFTILDAHGEELVNSTSPQGNIGCPVMENERAHFISMIQNTAQRTSPEAIKELQKSLQDYAETLR